MAPFRFGSAVGCGVLAPPHALRLPRARAEGGLACPRGCPGQRAAHRSRLGPPCAAGGAALFRAWGEAGTAAGHAIVPQEWQRRKLDWSDFIWRMFEGQASGAHALSRAPVGWQQGDAEADGTPTTAPDLVLAHERVRWGALWQAIDGGSALEEVPLAEWSGPLPPRLQAAQLRAAGKRFKRRTATPDGWHPRHVALLGDEVLEVLCDLLALLEALGVFPEDLEQVLVALIPKPTGGERPIGLYLALFRVWSAARVQALRDWERDSAQCPAFNTGGGQATTDVVWRQAVRAEADRAEMQPFLTLCCLGPRRVL